MKILNFGLSGLGQDAGMDLSFPDVPFDYAPIGAGDSGFAGDPGAVAGAAGPLTSTVYVPAGLDPVQVATAQAAALAPGETRVFVLPDGTSTRVVASASEPLAPDLNTIYKIGTTLIQYVMQPQPGGAPPRLVRRQLASGGGGLGLGVWLLLGLGALALARRR